MPDAREIDAAFMRSGLGLRLDAGLEDEFDRIREKATRHQIRVVLVAALVLTMLGLLVDVQAGILAEALSWKFGLQVPTLAIGFWATTRPNLAPGRLWLAGALPLLVTIAVVMRLAVALEPPITDRYATIAGLTAFAANVALPIKFRGAVVLTAMNVAVFVTIPLLLEPFAQVAPYLDILLFMSAIAMATTALVHARERAQKRSFLLTLTNQRQTLELQALVNELTQLAHRDPLTGAGNRRSFDMRYAATWRAAASRREEIALILIDVDHFKFFNDAAGHSAGDECLRAVAGAIAKGANCPIDMVMRYGGEEFALVLQSTTGRTAEAIRASVCALALPHPGLPPGNCVTVSVGKAFACPGRSRTHPEDLVRAADEALYEAKRTGRNRVVIAGGMAVAGA